MSPITSEEFALRLLDERDRLSLTQEQAAKLLGVPVRTLDYWENLGARQPAQVVKESVLGVLAASKRRRGKAKA